MPEMIMIFLASLLCVILWGNIYHLLCIFYREFHDYITRCDEQKDEGGYD